MSPAGMTSSAAIRRGHDFSCAHDGQSQPGAVLALQKAPTFLNLGLTMLLKMDPNE